MSHFLNFRLQEYVEELETRKANTPPKDQQSERDEKLSQFQVAITLLEGLLKEGEIKRERLNVKRRQKNQTLQAS